MHLLVAEDDMRLAEALTRILEDNGYQVDVVHDGQTAQEFAQAATYDVIILDVMMPKADGLTVTQNLRRAHINTPILLLTARDGVGDKITGYDSGADDYMTKPFSPAELMAHLRALTRRQGDVVFETITAGDLTLNLESCELSCGANHIRLSQKEFVIARALMASPGAVLSKESLISKAWGAASHASENNVEAYISFLRKKITHVKSKAHIETIRSVGYRLVEGSDETALY
jgi:DNA-binding response OmpR family regulator